MKQLRKLAIVLSASAMALTMTLSLVQPNVRSAAQNADSLTAIRVSTDVTDPFDAAWSKAPVLTAALEPQAKDEELNTFYGVHYPAVGEVKLQAAYDDKNVYVRAVWADDTMNSNFGYWTYDGTKWTQSKTRQDRISFAFDISGNKQFAALGCGAVCHAKDSSAGDYMGFPVGSTDTIDAWQWKASQTALVGYADDQWLGAYVDDKGPKTPSNDASTGAAPVANKNKAGDAPSFVYKTPTQPTTPLTPDNSVALDPAAKLETGYVVPGYVVARPAGSRADVNATAIYSASPAGKGTWTVVLSRALKTGNPEDHVFALNSSNVFGVAVFNNGDDKQHSTKNKLTLVIGQ